MIKDLPTESEMLAAKKSSDHAGRNSKNINYNQYNYTTPCAFMASATLMKPPMLAPLR